LKKQLEVKDDVLKTNSETQKQLLTTIDGQTKTEEANNRTIQQLLEKQKQLQATIHAQTMTVEALNQTVKMLRKHTYNVST
jgi:predicted RNase H-like nuclease (RuvC/YqgF family)